MSLYEFIERNDALLGRTLCQFKKMPERQQIALSFALECFSDYVSSGRFDHCLDQALGASEVAALSAACILFDGKEPNDDLYQGLTALFQGIVNLDARDRLGMSRAEYDRRVLAYCRSVEEAIGLKKTEQAKALHKERTQLERTFRLTQLTLPGL